MTQYLICPKKTESSRAMSVVRDLGRFHKSQEKISERSLEIWKEMRMDLMEQWKEPEF